MLPIHVKAVHEEHPELVRRELHNVTRAMHAAMGAKWAGDLLPEHFEPRAHFVFNYAARTGKWLRRKEMLFRMGASVRGRRVIAGANTDLVFTGFLRDLVLGSARQGITAYPSRVKIRMIGPAYFTLRPRGKYTARLAREVTASSPRHEKILAETGQRGFNGELRRLRQAKRLRKVTTT
jgi:hypothetical protein